MNKIQNAVIENVTIFKEDYGCLTVWLLLDYGENGIKPGFGGYPLYYPKNLKFHKIESVAGHFLWRVMEIAGVNRWEHLKGQTIRVKETCFGIEAIGHIIKEDWFNPSKDLKNI